MLFTTQDNRLLAQKIWEICDRFHETLRAIFQGESYNATCRPTSKFRRCNV